MKKLITLVLMCCSLHLYAQNQNSASFLPPEFQAQEKASCDIRAGLADSYVLALSSQAGFCKTYGSEAGKPECQHLSANSYEAKHLTLHGLWPNQNACGQYYGFCTAKAKPNHCDYSPLNLSPAVSDDLKQLMPSYRYGSCLERHEWNKHGSCQDLNSDDYFAMAMGFAKEFDASLFGQYIKEHIGQKVSLSSLRKQLTLSLGAENAAKVYLGCNKNILVDIYISLPALINSDESLKSLISKAPDYPSHDSCSSSVFISDVYAVKSGIWS